MNYYISDLHFFCNSQTRAGVNYDNRPFANVEEMNNHILKRWNKKVTNGDTVYILGDIALRGKSDDLVYKFGGIFAFRRNVKYGLK